MAILQIYKKKKKGVGSSFNKNIFSNYKPNCVIICNIKYCKKYFNTYIFCSQHCQPVPPPVGEQPIEKTGEAPV